MRRFQTLFVAALGALAGGCSDDDAAPIAPFDLDFGGGFSATVFDGNRLVVRAADGRVLLDGLAAGDVASDGPPLVGFATRDVTTAYEMQFGAFKPTETAAGPWRVARTLEKKGGEGTSLTLLDGNGSELAKVQVTAPEEGHLVLDFEPGPGPERRISYGFSCNGDDHFAGFGSQTWDVDHRGQTVPACVQEQGIGKDTTDEYTGAWFLVGRRHSSHIPIPQYLARRGYVLTAETNLEAKFALCSESDTAARIEVTMPAKLHVFDGPAPKTALTRASATFGRPRMPPKVAFAPWLDAIYGSQNVRDVAQRARDAKIPASVIWTEDWRGGEWVDKDYRLKEEWEVDPTLYPDFSQLADDLHASGYHFHVYFNPFVYQESKAWTETAAQGLLVQREDGTPYTFAGAKFSDTGLLDVDNPEARAWAIGKMRAVMALGADGWMNDFAEWLPTDSVTAAGSGFDRHNLYPVKWQETAREAIDGAPDGQADRLFFGRSGWLGTAPLADVIWAGDQRTTMDEDDGFPTILPIGIGLGIAGISTYGHDIAGYQSSTNGPSDKETYLRWTTLGAWSPVMRTHHGSRPADNWVWWSDAETTEVFRKSAALHMALVPYFEGLAKEASETGVPIWRGLAIEHPDEAELWPIKDQVLVGPRVMLAPVVAKGATSRDVVIPEGRFFPWENGPAVEGPTSINVPAASDAIPVFAQAGAVVPMYPDGVMTLVHGSAEVPDASTVGDDRVVHVFLGESGAFDEVDGLSYTLAQSADGVASAPTFAWQGAALAACASPAVAPCVSETAGQAEVWVTGPGELAVSDGGAPYATFTAKGGAADRALRIVVRY